MCVSVYSSLLLLTLNAVAIFPGSRMAAEGLSLYRQERGADHGLLSGEDFLSVFVSSSLRQAYHETSTPESTTTTSLDDSTVEATSFPVTTVSVQEQNDSVVEVRVSSSVGRTLINKNLKGVADPLEDPKDAEGFDDSTTELPNQNVVVAEEHPSLVAEANKSEFNVEETEPITTNGELATDFSQSYPASVQSLPKEDFNAKGFRLEESLKDKLRPIQGTVIYHGNPTHPGSARSVSYSTVVQAAPEPWDDSKHERHERHFNGASPPENKINDTQKPAFTTEKNWEIQAKPYAQQRLPIVYGKPEQNYEVDESASVMTNGRIHGVQPAKEVKIGESRKTDDNQKVGYVVEGRNYRKYRVEERTSDGFIVGEYGVVSHDDGSLRGVRYTADGTISPRLIYDTLMKFLSL